jgi:hypothetical protein
MIIKPYMMKKPAYKGLQGHSFRLMRKTIRPMELYFLRGFTRFAQ